MNEIKDLVIKNRRLTIRDLTDTINISFGSVQTILKDVLFLKKVKFRLVPKTLNFLEKQRRVEVYETMLSEYQNKMECIITGDETWIYAYDPTNRKQPTNQANTVQKVNQDRKDRARVVQKSRSC